MTIYCQKLLNNCKILLIYLILVNICSIVEQKNQKRWQGETVALLKSLNLNKFKLEQFSAEPSISYIQI